MAYLASGSVDVFPATRRSDEYQRRSRLITEYNFTNMVKLLTERPSYCVTKDYDANKPFEFYIYGYYFKISQASLLVSTTGAQGTVYAYITLDTGNAIPEISGLDDEGRYEGLNLTNTFSTEWDEQPNVHYLKLLEKNLNTGAWQVPTDSLVKFTRNSVELDVDGGQII